jgi:hypothetical protein
MERRLWFQGKDLFHNDCDIFFTDTDTDTDSSMMSSRSLCLNINRGHRHRRIHRFHSIHTIPFHL